MVKWIEEDNKKGWKLGWYIVIIKNYIKVCDVIEVEYVSESGKVYKVNVKDSVENGILRFYVIICEVLDFYD